jgi:hypothetical protein
MLPHKHALLSAAVGAIGWWTTGEPAACVAALATGVLPDIDHIVDYSYYHWQGVHRLILPLHGYEFALLGTVIALRANNKVLGIAVCAYFAHLVADQLENHTHIWGYSLLFRAWNRFRVEAISTVPEAAVRGRMADIERLKNLLRRG